MIILTVGEIEEKGNSLVCAVCDDNEEAIIEQRPLGELFQEFVLSLKAIETEDRFNQFAEKIKADLLTGIDFIERLQLPVGSDSVH